jgi:hypothetical protein
MSAGGAALRAVLAGALAAGAAAPRAAAAPGQLAAAEPAGPVQVSLRVEPPRVTVGDLIRLSIDIRYPDGYEVGAAAPGNAWGDLAVRSVRRGEPTRAGEGAWRRTDEITAAAFAPGTARAPALEIEFRAADGSFGKVATPAVEVAVDSVLGGDASAEIADIRGPANLPRPLWPWIAAGAALAAAALLGAWVLARRRRALIAGLFRRPAERPLPPHEWALRELERLAASGMLAGGRWLDYHVALAEGIKEYMSRRFGIPTLERTTAEVLAEARGARLGSGLIGELRLLLEACDQVKFARHRPQRSEAEALLEKARGLVLASRPAEPPPGAEAGTAPSAAPPAARPPASARA